MAMQDLILAIDNGTQSVRALLFDKNGDLVGKGKEEIEPYVSPQPGWAEQDPEYYWESLNRACLQLWESSGVDPSRVAAVSLTTQRGTVINLDQRGKPLRPAIVWLDQRKAEIDEPVPGIWKWLFKLAGVEDVVKRFREKAQAIWIAQNQPDIWRATHKFLLLSGYLSFKLTGEYKDSVACQVGYLPFDFKGLKWASLTDWRYKVMPELKPEMLPDLVEPGQTLGEITEEAAVHLGISSGLPLFACASDKACEILGSGGTEPTTACMSYGTTATINTTNTKYVEPIRYLPAYPSALPGKYSSEIMVYRGFWMVSWFKHQFGLREEKRAKELGVLPETLFDELVKSVPPGSMGLLLQPYWSPGVRDPGPEAKGGIIGFGDVHTRAHIYRAILEGIAYSLREGKEKLEKRNGKKIKVIRVAGGGSQSDQVMQLTADIFGLPVERPHTYETSGLGAAMSAAVGLGWHDDYTEAAEKMTRIGARFIPEPEAQGLYQRLYSEVYLHMYRQLKPLYRSIQNITGYPE